MKLFGSTRRWEYRRRQLKKTLQSKKAILLVAAALVLSALLGAGLFRLYNQKVARTVSQANYKAEAEDLSITKEGVRYVPDSSLRSYLFLGVDDVGLNYENYGRGGRTDTVLLLVKDGKELRILEISRDTMTAVDTYDSAGDYLSTGVMQLNMQYSYGDSPRRSAYLTKRAVSALLGGVSIHGAIALNMSGIAPVVDALGGIDVRMEEDCSYIDPVYTLGAEVHMDGAAAEYFIRWRDKEVPGGNDARMSRHTWFIRQMLTQADDSKASRLLKAADPYLNTDLTAEELQALSECTLAETVRLPGETRRGALHDEFYVDEEALREVLIHLLYTVS